MLVAQHILPFLLERLPLLIPIVWMAMYASRRHSQALRLEEDYAHKETMSKSFEGYKTQIIELEEDLPAKTSTLNLINKSLEALSLHPGRIYEGKHENISPIHSLTRIFSRDKTNGE